MAIAVVQAVVTLPGYANIPLRLKWPNDIYLGSDLKLGGVVVEATTLGPQVIVNIGECWGLVFVQGRKQLRRKNKRKRNSVAEKRKRRSVCVIVC